jgi:hypothetical protein
MMDTEAHDFPLDYRLVKDVIGKWLDTATAIASAANGSPPINDYERGFQQGVEQMRYLHLDNYWYTLVPQILDQLKRSGLLIAPNTIRKGVA